MMTKNSFIYRASQKQTEWMRGLTTDLVEYRLNLGVIYFGKWNNLYQGFRNLTEIWQQFHMCYRELWSITWFFLWVGDFTKIKSEKFI